MLAGYLLTSYALLGMGLFEPHTGYLIIDLIFVVMGIGMELALPPINIAAMAAVHRECSGMASATVNATRQTGSALGIAVLDVILSDRAVSALGAYLEQAMVQANLSKTLAKELVNNQGASVAAGTRLNPAMLAGLLQRSPCRGAHRRHRYHRCCYFNLVYGLAAQFHSEKDDRWRCLSSLS
jgi:hypothetical protein